MHTYTIAHFINWDDEDLMYSAVWGRIKVLPNISRNSSTFSAATDSPAQCVGINSVCFESRGFSVTDTLPNREMCSSLSTGYTCTQKVKIQIASSTSSTNLVVTKWNLRNSSQPAALDIILYQPCKWNKIFDTALCMYIHVCTYRTLKNYVIGKN